MGDYSVSRSIVIAAPTERILPHLVSFPEWRAWSPWEGYDAELRRDYRGAESGVGAEYQWAGNKQAGEGIMTITAASPTEVGVRVQFLKPFASVNDQTFVLEPAPGPEGSAATLVTWSMAGSWGWFMTILTRILFPIDKTVGKDFERGLAALKGVVESE